MGRERVFGTVLLLAGILSILVAVFLARPLPRDRAAQGPEKVEKGAAATAATPPKAPEEKPAEPSPAKGPWTVAGRVLWKEGKPARGIAVTLEPGQLRQETAFNGKFSFEGIPSDIEIRIVVDEPASALIALEFELPEPEGEGEHVQDLGDLILEPPASLVVKLLGPGDAPIESGKVTAWKSGNVGDRREGTLRAGGEYAFDRLRSGLWRILGEAPGHAPASETVEIPEADSFTLRLEEGRRIAGSVLTLNGMPIEGAKLATENYPGPDLEATTDSSGRFLFDVLGKGSYRVKASAMGFIPDEKEINSGEEDSKFWLFPEAVFSGTVVDIETGNSLADVKVMIWHLDSEEGEEADDETDLEGAFEIREVPPGTYKIESSSEEYIDVSAGPFEARPGDRISGILLSTRKGLCLQGKVLDARTLEPIEEASVELLRIREDENDYVRGGHTDSKGLFKLQGIPEGEFEIHARREGYLSGEQGEQQVFVEAGKEQEVTLLLERGPVISGRVLDPEGNSVPEANLKIIQTYYDSYNNSKTDKEGRYRITADTNREYVLIAHSKNHSPSTPRKVIVDENEDHEKIDLVLTKSGTIRGRIIDPKGSGIKGARLVLSNDEDLSKLEDPSLYMYHRFSKDFTTEEADGSYEFTGLTPWTYKIQAEATCRITVTRKGIEVSGGQATEGIDLVLPSSGNEVLSGRVIDSNGKPVEGARVESGQQSTESDAEGQFVLDCLPKGETSLTATGEGFSWTELQVTAPEKGVLVRLERLAMITGRVRAGEKEYFRRGDIRAHLLSRDSTSDSEEDFQDSYSEYTEIDCTGRFRLEIPAGNYLLEAKVPGFAPILLDVSLKPGERREDIIIDLKKGGSIEGKVFIEDTGEPIEDASVIVDRIHELPEVTYYFSSVTTKSNGSFFINEIHEGTVDLEVTHDQYVQKIQRGIQVQWGKVTQVNIGLQSGGGVRGIVLRSRLPAGRIKVEALDPNDGHALKGKYTNAVGQFEIIGLPAGEIILSAIYWSEKISACVKVTIIEGRIVEVTIPTDRVVLSGTMTAGGVPLQEIRFRLMEPQTNTWLAWDSTDSTGRYYSISPSRGSCVFWIAGKEGGAGKHLLNVPRGAAEVRMDIDLPPGEIRGAIVESGSGSPVEDALILAFPTGKVPRSIFSPDMVGWDRSDSKGRFAIPYLPAGVHSLKVLSRGHREARFEASPDGREIRLEMHRGTPLRIEVSDPQGRPAPGAIVEAMDEGGADIAGMAALLIDFDGSKLLGLLAPPALAGGDGSFTIKNASPGTYRVRASRDGKRSGEEKVRLSEGEPATARLVLPE